IYFPCVFVLSDHAGDVTGDGHPPPGEAPAGDVGPTVRAGFFEVPPIGLATGPSRATLADTDPLHQPPVLDKWLGRYLRWPLVVPASGRGCRPKTMGSKPPADCARRDTTWHLARVLTRIFTFCLPVSFAVLTSKEGCGRWVQQQRRGVCRGGRRGDG